MHIVQIISSYGHAFIGNEIHSELAQAIIARGHRYTFLTLARHDASAGIHTWDDHGITVYEMGQDRSLVSRTEKFLSKRIFHYPLFLFALRTIGGMLQHVLQDADLILVEGAYPLGAIAAFWQPVDKRPLAIVLQGGDLHRQDQVNYGFGRYFLPRLLAQVAIQRASLLRTYSPLMYHTAIEHGADPARVHVVAQNIGESCYLPATDWHTLATLRQQARQTITSRHTLQGSHLLLTVGRLLPIKGYDGLIRSLPAIEHQTQARVELVLCGPDRPAPGSGNYRSHLEHLAASLGVHDRLTFTGELSHAAVREYVAAADLLVIPSIMEGGAKVLMEGAAVGTPFVATETAGTPAFLPDGGLTVPPVAVAPDALPRAIAVLLRNAALRLRLSQQAFERAPIFCAERRADELLPLYEKALCSAT